MRLSNLLVIVDSGLMSKMVKFESGLRMANGLKIIKILIGTCRKKSKSQVGRRAERQVVSNISTACGRCGGFRILLPNISSHLQDGALSGFLLLARSYKLFTVLLSFYLLSFHLIDVLSSAFVNNRNRMFVPGRNRQMPALKIMICW